jgi:hypothetical protein
VTASGQESIAVSTLELTSEQDVRELRLPICAYGLVAANGVQILNWGRATRVCATEDTVTTRGTEVRRIDGISRPVRQNGPSTLVASSQRFRCRHQLYWPQEEISSDAIVSTGVKNVVEAGEKLRVGRYVMQGGILSSVDDLSFANRIIVRMLRVIFSKAVIEF